MKADDVWKREIWLFPTEVIFSNFTVSFFQIFFFFNRKCPQTSDSCANLCFLLVQFCSVCLCWDAMRPSRSPPKFTHEYLSLKDMDRNSCTSMNVFEVSDFMVKDDLTHIPPCGLLIGVFLQWALEGNVPALEGQSGNLNTRDGGGAAPLHYASSKGHIRVINLIVRIAGSQGQTRVHSGERPPLIISAQFIR